MSSLEDNKIKSDQVEPFRAVNILNVYYSRITEGANVYPQLLLDE